MPLAYERFSVNTKNHSEVGSFPKAHTLWYHSTQGVRASFRTCIQSNKEEKEEEKEEEG